MKFLTSFLSTKYRKIVFGVKRLFSPHSSDFCNEVTRRPNLLTTRQFFDWNERGYGSAPMPIYPLLNELFWQVLELLPVSFPPTSEILNFKVAIPLGLQVVRPNAIFANFSQIKHKLCYPKKRAAENSSASAKAHKTVAFVRTLILARLTMLHEAMDYRFGEVAAQRQAPNERQVRAGRVPVSVPRSHTEGNRPPGWGWWEFVGKRLSRHCVRRRSRVVTPRGRHPAWSSCWNFRLPLSASVHFLCS